MSPWIRALVGATVSALVTLIVHPVSRPYMVGVTSRASPTVLSKCIDSNALTLPSPNTLTQASLWMQLAAAKIASHEALSDKERVTVLAVAQRASERQTTNAFWLQMQAIIYADQGLLGQATTCWLRASQCQQWDDGQTARLKVARSRIAELTSAQQSWQLAYLYYSRSDAVSDCLLRVTRDFLSRADFDTPSGLSLRYATLLNGDLLQKHARSTKGITTSTEMLELTTYPPGNVGDTFLKPKMLWSGRLKVIRNLTKVLHQPDSSAIATKIYALSDAISALTVHVSNGQQTEWLAFATVLCSSISGALVIITLFGAFIWGLGQLISWRLAKSRQVKPQIAIIIAIALGGLVLLLTSYWPAAFATMLCAGFLTVAPDRSRTLRPTDLGPFFSFMAMVVGLICSLMFASYLVGNTPAANAILPNLGVPSAFIGKPLWAGLSAVAFCLILLIAPIWAVVHRIGTPYVLSLILMRFGSFVAVMGLVLAITLAPLSVYADRRLETTFGELVDNEPVHYLIHQ